ncbi:MAG TPA: helix-turn-helix domain-containing protein, partial [Solirubrobacteraceae bacterium]
SLLMVESGDEDALLRVAATAAPSLAPARMDAVHLLSGEWLATSDEFARQEVQARTEAQLGSIGAAGGAVESPAGGWAWAFPLHSLSGLFGHLIAVADEAPTEFERFLLRMLAQQTGIALANVRLHMQERASAAALRTMNANLTESIEALQASTDVHNRLTRVAASGEGEAGIAQAVHDLTGHPVAIEDRHGNLRAWAGAGRPEPYAKDPPAERRTLIERALAYDGPLRVDDRLVVVVSPSADVLATIALVDPEASASPLAAIALEHAGTVLAMELARLHGMAETELRLSRDLVEDLLTGTDEESAFVRAEALGYDLARPHKVVVVGCGADGGSELFHAVRRAARDAGVGSLLVARGGMIVVLSDRDQPWETFLAAVVEELHGRPCRVGIGGACSQPAEYPRSYREARLALKVLEMSGAPDQAIAYDDLGVYRLFAAADAGTDVEGIVRHWLGALLEYDAAKNGALVETLTLYLEQGGNYDSTSAALSIHRNTLKYRLRKIKELSGHDLSDADTVFNLQLATRACGTLAALHDL